MKRPGIEIDDVPVTWWTRVRDLFRRKWTDEQLAERVALSVANTYYGQSPWAWRVPIYRVVPQLFHGFTEYTPAERAEIVAKEKASGGPYSGVTADDEDSPYTYDPDWHWRHGWVPAPDEDFSGPLHRYVCECGARLELTDSGTVFTPAPNEDRDADV